MISDDMIQKLKIARLANKVAREDQTVVFSDGTKVYPDTAPGVGWVVERKSHKCYFRSKEMSLAYIGNGYSTVGLKMV